MNKLLSLIIVFSLITSLAFAFTEADIIDKGFILESTMAWVTIKENTVIDRDFESYLWIRIISLNKVYGTMCILIHKQIGNAFTNIGQIIFDKGFPEIIWEKK